MSSGRRLPDSAHSSQPWRVHEVAGDFRVEDVWQLPGRGGPEDFPRLVRFFASLDPLGGSSRASRTLFAIRAKLGEVLGLDETEGASGSEPSLRDRLPADLREGPPGPEFDALPFTTLYLTDDEFAAEAINRTVHGVIHVGRIPDGDGFRAQLAILVKPNGLLGTAYLAAIRPFRHLIVYPALMRDAAEAWVGR